MGILSGYCIIRGIFAIDNSSSNKDNYKDKILRVTLSTYLLHISNRDRVNFQVRPSINRPFL